MAGLPKSVTLRPVTATDCPALSDLCLRSKAHWGYSADFLASCRAELTLHPEDLDHMPAMMAEVGGNPVGVVQVSIEGRQAELEKLFVHPGVMGRGIGRQLFDWAVRCAAQAGAEAMVIAADPGAVPFYIAMGAELVGEEPSQSIAGRTLPVLHLSLT